VASPLGFLERAGFRPAAVDLAAERLDPAAVARARLVAISVPMHTALRLGVRALAAVRAANPRAHVCLYGLYATLNAEHLLAHGADSVLGGEVEQRLVDLAQALERGERPAPPRGPVLERLAFGVPSRTALPALARYAPIDRGDGRLEVAGYTEASRGCLHACRHCPIPPVYGGRFFALPREVVLEDIRRQVAEGARHITFGDPDFFNGPTHGVRLARALHAEFPEVTFDATIKVEHLLRHRDLVPALVESGCAFVVTAVESLNDTVLANLAKGHTRADVLEVLALARATGLVLRPTLVPFTPWETLRSYLDLFEVVDAEGLVEHIDPVHYTLRLLVPPGSLLIESDAMRPYVGDLDPARFTHRWVHPDPRMDALQGEVTALVERSLRAGEAPAETFEAMWEAARCAGASSLASAVPAPRRRVRAGGAPGARRPPRLGEAWFC
jgi:radical SAM superfamily enzyme YgiQ (UPF0313 family)